MDVRYKFLAFRFLPLLCFLLSSKGMASGKHFEFMDKNNMMDLKEILWATFLNTLV